MRKNNSIKHKTSDFYREVIPPDSLSSMSTGTPSGKSKSPKGEDASSLPNGDASRNIGRPGPDSPNLKTKNLDRSESYGRTPAEGFDGGYVHDSGSGSARVIPYDSGYSNNSSPLRNAARPIRIDKVKIKELTKDAIKTLENIIDKSTEKTLSEALKRKTMYGKIYLGSYTVTHETTGYRSSVDINISVVEKKGRRGLYTYKKERGLHLVDIYLEDQPISFLRSPFYKISLKSAWVKRIYSTLLHEITHAVERIKYLEDRGTSSMPELSNVKTRKDISIAKRDYYNHPAEVKAFLQQIADEVEEYLNQKHEGVTKDSIKDGWGNAFGYYGSKTWQRVSKYLTPKNQKYIKKAVLTHLVDMLE